MIISTSKPLDETRMATKTPRLRYTAVSGFFQQDHAPTNPASEAVRHITLSLVTRAPFVNATKDHSTRARLD
jgi:hypothetical protein